MLLLVAGIEVNPGLVSCGLLHVHDVSNKLALIHDTINDHKLDMLMLTEVAIAHDAPAAIKNDIAPKKYSCLHASRVERKKKLRAAFYYLQKLD